MVMIAVMLRGEFHGEKQYTRASHSRQADVAASSVPAYSRFPGRGNLRVAMGRFLNDQPSQNHRAPPLTQEKPDAL
jgi:hypothetical protein